MIQQMKMQQSIVDDEFWTQIELKERLCKNYKINPKLDAAANEQNKKCDEFLDNALFQEWTLKDGTVVDVWCNPPHSMTEEFIRRADAQYRKYNMNILMIFPTNVESSIAFHEIIEDELTVKVENHPIFKRPRFLKHGFKKTKFSSRNAYRAIIWRSKND